MADFTLLNLNMLYIRYLDGVDRERHVPLGPLYLTAALERSGYTVDFRDYQLAEYAEPFRAASLIDFLHDPAPVIGVSVMANLLPFTLLALKEVKASWPDRVIVLGGVGPKSVEAKILKRCPWIDVIVCGEAERIAPRLLAALGRGQDLSTVPGIFFRDRDGSIISNPRPPRIETLDELHLPAFDHVDLSRYAGYGVVSSRGCPWPCTFCSVAPIWDHQSSFRSVASVIEEMAYVHEKTGNRVFLFQDEYFLAGRERMLEFSAALKSSGLNLVWKAFGRVNLTDRETMEAMAGAGCVEIRYGIESGSDFVLEKTKKGFTAAEALEVVGQAVEIFPGVDAFFVWGFPFESMDHFHETLFTMLTMREMGARILPSLLCYLPQTEIYRELADPERLEFCPELFPEYMVTGHEVYRSFFVEIDEEHGGIYRFIRENPDIFPGFFHWDLQGNVLPKLSILQEYGFYPRDGLREDAAESCGAHSPRVRIAAK